MRAAITGASGLLGANLAVALLETGASVRATRRRSSQIDHLSEFDIEWVEASLSDRSGLERAFEGADVVFHCAAMVSILPRPTDALRKANVDGTRRVIEAVRGAGVGRLVHCSTVGAVGLMDGPGPCTEEAAWNFAERGMADGYVTTKRMSEDLVTEAASDGLEAVIVNPGYMLGPYDAKPSSGGLLLNIVQGKMPGWTPGTNCFVDVRDVARGMIAAAERGRTGERYILGGHNMQYRDFYETVAEVAGVAAPRRRIPRWVAEPLGWVGDLSYRITGREPQITSVTVGYGFCDTFQFSSAKAERELGYAIGPIEPAIRDALEWFRGHGML